MNSAPGGRRTVGFGVLLALYLAFAAAMVFLGGVEMKSLSEDVLVAATSSHR